MRRESHKELLRRLKRQQRAAEQTYRERLGVADQLAVSLRRQSEVIIQAYQLVSRTKPDARRRKVEKQSYETDSHSTLYLRDLIIRAQQGDEAARIDLQAGDRAGGIRCARRSLRPGRAAERPLPGRAGGLHPCRT